MFTSSEFRDFCGDNKVRLRFPLVNYLDDLPYKSYSPSVIYDAVVTAGRKLRKDPGSRLSNRPFNDKAASQAEGDPALRQLVAMINASHHPIKQVGQTAVEPLFYSSRNSRWLDVCENAELNFFETIADITERRTTDVGFRVIEDEAGPLFLTKSRGVSSSLAFKNFVINGIPYPAGSLCRIDLKTDTTTCQEPPATYYEALPGSVGQVPVGSIRDISFLRMSAFCTSGEDRAQFVGGLESTPDDDPDHVVLSPLGRSISEWSIDDVSSLVAYSYPPLQRYPATDQTPFLRRSFIHVGQA